MSPSSLAIPGARRAGVRVHRLGALHRKDLRHRHGVPLTSPARTALDLAAAASESDLEHLLATVRVRGLITDRDLAAVLSRYSGHRGAARLTAVLGRAGGPAFTRSDAERLMLSPMRGAGCPHRRSTRACTGSRSTSSGLTSA